MFLFINNIILNSEHITRIDQPEMPLEENGKSRLTIYSSSSPNINVLNYDKYDDAVEAYKKLREILEVKNVDI